MGCNSLSQEQRLKQFYNRIVHNEPDKTRRYWNKFCHFKPIIISEDISATKKGTEGP